MRATVSKFVELRSGVKWMVHGFGKNSGWIPIHEFVISLYTALIIMQSVQYSLECMVGAKLFLTNLTRLFWNIIAQALLKNS